MHESDEKLAFTAPSRELKELKSENDQGDSLNARRLQKSLHVCKKLKQSLHVESKVSIRSLEISKSGGKG